MVEDKCEIMEPLVSIVCITYNHEPYLRKALDSFLMQKTSFAYEIVLAEDCSTDGTRKICEEYAAKYPDIIHYVWSENNVGAVENEARAIRAAKGKYIALCEGDDYWTDSMKLQKQVDFMESHPEYSVTFHRYKIHHVDTDKWQEDNAQWLFVGKNIEGTDISIEQAFEKWITQYLTAVFRRDCYDFAWADKYLWYRDSHMFYHLMKVGKAHLFAFDGGVYNKTGEGVYTNLSDVSAGKKSVDVARELYEQNRDEYTRKNYANVLQWQIYNNKRHLGIKWCYSWELFRIEHMLKRLVKNLLR